VRYFLVGCKRFFTAKDICNSLLSILNLREVEMTRDNHVKGLEERIHKEEKASARSLEIDELKQRCSILKELLQERIGED
jgi:hypothetical protein